MQWVIFAQLYKSYYPPYEFYVLDSIYSSSKAAMQIASHCPATAGVYIGYAVNISCLCYEKAA